MLPLKISRLSKHIEEKGQGFPHGRLQAPKRDNRCSKKHLSCFDENQFEAAGYRLAIAFTFASQVQTMIRVRRFVLGVWTAISWNVPSKEVATVPSELSTLADPRVPQKPA